jgi:acyl-CoA dehydrogenase
MTRMPEPAAAPASSPYYTPEHETFRATVRRFVAKEIEPFATQWDEAGEFPRELYRKAAALGVLQLGFPEEYGGIACDRFYRLIWAQELAGAGAGGISASLNSHTIGAPPIARFGSEAMKRRVLPPILAGERISALAITEPGAGSDVAAIKTTARRSGDVYVVRGEKTFITSGMRADFYTVAVRTGGAGMGGLSLLLIERETPGFTRTALRKMGWWASDTATLHFDDARVPAENLIGPENGGFKVIMANFNDERLGMAYGANGFARVAFEEALAYARLRETFGKPLIAHQVIRHKLVDMAQRVAATQALIELIAWRVDRGDYVVPELCMLKNQATQTLAFCASEAVQILGGAGFVRGSKAERIYREVKVNAIGGGAEEIMKDLAARQMAW